MLLGDVVVSTALANAHIAQPTDSEVLVLDRPGVSSDAARRAITPLAQRYGGEVQDQAQYTTASAGGLRLLLNLVYVLLLLAIVIALLGITNTLSLSVYERQREIGLLRAVGQTRRQTRSVLRIEALIIAAFGTLLGVGVGAFIGWSVFEALGTTGARFSLPVSRLVLIVVIGACAGALAGWRPARRAARVPILDAIAVRSAHSTAYGRHHGGFDVHARRRSPASQRAAVAARRALRGHPHCHASGPHHRGRGTATGISIPSVHSTPARSSSPRSGRSPWPGGGFTRSRCTQSCSRQRSDTGLRAMGPGRCSSR